MRSRRAVPDIASGSRSHWDWGWNPNGNMGATWEQHGNNMGTPWENRKSWENMGTQNIWND
jgi:hypothetical protein